MRSLRLAKSILVVTACVVGVNLTGCATTTMKPRLATLTALQQHADSAYAHHHWRAAAHRYQALVKSVPENAAYWFRLGNSYARVDRLQSAANAYRAALQRNPRIVPAWHNLGAVLLHQSQVAFQQAAGHAAPGDPLKQSSTWLSERIGVVRKGASSHTSHSHAPAQEGDADPSSVSPAPPRSRQTGRRR